MDLFFFFFRCWLAVRRGEESLKIINEGVCPFLLLFFFQMLTKNMQMQRTLIASSSDTEWNSWLKLQNIILLDAFPDPLERLVCRRCLTHAHLTNREIHLPSPPPLYLCRVYIHGLESLESFIKNAEMDGVSLYAAWYVQKFLTNLIMSNTH